MKKRYSLLFLIFIFSFLTAGDIWLHMISSGTPIATYYLGDSMGEYYINFEVGQTSWNATDVGISTANTGNGDNWETAN